MRARLARAKAYLQVGGESLMATIDLAEVAKSKTVYVGEAHYLMGMGMFASKSYDIAESFFESAVEGKYLPAQAMLEKTRRLMAGGVNQALEAKPNANAGANANSESKELNSYIKKLNTLIAEEKPFIEKLNATAEGDHKNESLNRAALHPKTQAVVDFIAAESPRLAGFGGERAQKARDATQNILAKRKESLHSTRTFQVTAYRVLGDLKESQAGEKALMSRMDQARKDNDQAAWQRAKTQLLAQARITRQLLVDGLKLLAPYNNDPEQPALKTSLETALATLEKTIEVMQK